MTTSGIQAWTQENIKNAPTSAGVFALRSTPINGDVLKLEKAANLQEALNGTYLNQTTPGTQFFEWFQAEPQENLDSILAELVTKYHI